MVYHGRLDFVDEDVPRSEERQPVRATQPSPLLKRFAASATAALVSLSLLGLGSASASVVSDADSPRSGAVASANQYIDLPKDRAATPSESQDGETPLPESDPSEQPPIVPDPELTSPPQKGGDEKETDSGGGLSQQDLPDSADSPKSPSAAEDAQSSRGDGLSPMSVEIIDGDDVYHMPDSGRPYLAFEIKDTTGTAVPGATVSIQGPRSGNNTQSQNRWTTTVDVIDCVTDEDACPTDSLDQDSRPGHFSVDRLTATSNPASLSTTSRYRIGASNVAPSGYRWKTPALAARIIPPIG